jgi:hypothetical protein
LEENMLKPFALAGLSMLAFAIPGTASSADKPVPEAVLKVVLENDSVRVLDVRFPPGAVNKMRERPDRVIHYFTPAHWIETYADGRKIEKTRKAGETVFGSAETTEVENVGKSEVHLLSIQLKSKGAVKGATAVGR